MAGNANRQERGRKGIGFGRGRENHGRQRRIGGGKACARVEDMAERLAFGFKGFTPNG